jgi:hypothetical protein
MPRKAHLWVGERPVPLSAIWIHHQTNPYPGGLQYRLRIDRGVADTWLSLHRHQWSDILHAGIWFQSLFSHLVGDQKYAAPFAFVLNTVEAIDVQRKYVEIQGTASPFVSRYRRP